jgi:hypothetical protein
VPLIDVELGGRGVAPGLPDAAQQLISEGELRIAAFLRDRPHTAPAFVPSDFPEVYRNLRSIVACNAAPGRVLCEWGSGMGVIACLGAMLGFRAYGIEIEPDLARAARELEHNHRTGARFACGTFIPPGEVLPGPQEDFYWLSEGGTSGYEELGLRPDELDVVFAYPWPGEEETILSLFERIAATGALLVTYRGLEGVEVQRKIGRRRRRSPTRGGR